MIALIFILALGTTFGIDNKEFFDKVAEQRSQGAEWHYVGPKPLDPTALSIPLQCMTAEVDKDSVPCGEPYILWKLKK